MEYLQELRKLVGHRPLLMVGAAALIVDGKNHLLLMKRSNSGCWVPPGGAVELREAVEAAARREVRSMLLFGVFSGPKLFHRYPNGDEVYNHCLRDPRLARRSPPGRRAHRIGLVRSC
jgi:hypothetical protein